MLEITPPLNKNLSKATNNLTTATFREHLKKEGLERKKCLLHLIWKYLSENNLHGVAEALQIETQIGTQYQVCDNIDLDIILQEFQSFYFTKFQKQPKILRKINSTESTPNKMNKDKQKKQKPVSTASSKETVQQQQPESESFQFDIVKLTKELSLNNETTFSEQQPRKSLENFEHYSSEWREMADQIIKHIIPKTLGVSFQDCISLSDTIERLKEAIIYPLDYPDLFENVRSWKGILLYGPPGTGKTLLAKAVACESRTTFINVTSSAFISKWRGESEKLVKVLFDVAKIYAPSTIFIDEIDALASTSHDSHSHEASRRFKSELLTQIDGIVQSEDIFVMATSNTPWAIDNALLRRFEKRILVPLPNSAARFELFQHYFAKNGESFKNDEIEKFVTLTDNFSGSDLKNLCKEVEMIVIREKLIELKKGDKKTIARKATVADVIAAMKKIRPLSDTTCYKKYIDWGEKHGAL